MLCGSVSFLLLGLAGAPAGETVPDPVQAGVRRGEVLLSAGVPARALKEFEQAKRQSQGPCEECEWGMARAWHRMGKRRETLSSCDWIAGNATTDAMRIQALNLRAILLGATGSSKAEMDAAEAIYRELIRMRPLEPNLSYNLALLLYRKGDGDGGRAALEHYLELAPDGEAALGARRILEKPTLADKTFAPAFSLVAKDGRRFRLADLAGRIVVLDFWATWCGPCVASLPELRRLTTKYPEDRLVVISVSADEDESAWNALIEKEKMGWPQYRDRDRGLRRLFGIRAFPTYLVIDGDGVFVKRLEGFDSRQSIVARLRNAVGPALGESR